MASERAGSEVMRVGELAQVRQPAECESRRADAVPFHLPCGGMGEGKMPSTPHPLPPAAGRKAGPRVKRVEELALCLLVEAHRRAGPAPHPGSTLELTLLVEVQVSQSCGHESEQQSGLLPLPCKPCGGKGEENMPSSLPLATCSRQESRPWGA